MIKIHTHDFMYQARDKKEEATKGEPNIGGI
jgi:hypothetical protein